MNIAIFTHNFPLNLNDRKDAGFFIYETVNKLSEENNVSVFCPNYFGKKHKYNNFKLFWFPRFGSKYKLASLNINHPISWFYYLSFFISGIFYLPYFLIKNKPEVIICYWSFPNGVFALIGKIFFRVKYITFSLGSDIFVFGQKPFIFNLNKIILTSASKRIGNSYKICRQVKKISGRNCIFIPSTTNFNFNKFNNSIIKKDNKFNYLFVGRLEKVKGPDLLLEAFNSLVLKDKKVFLHIVGDGEMQAALKNYVDTNNIKSYVKFYGNISDQNTLADIYKIADCLVIPSRSESMPFVAIEASNFSLPIVASDVGDLKYFVKKYKIGLIFSKDNKNDLQYCLKKVSKIKINKINFKNIKNDYSFNTSFNTLNNIIHEIK